MIPRLRVVRALSVNFSGGGGVPADKPIVHSSCRDVLPGRGDSAPKLLLVCEQQRGADEGRDTKHGALLAASQPASPINRCVHGRVIFLRTRDPRLDAETEPGKRWKGSRTFVQGGRGGAIYAEGAGSPG